MLDLRGFGASFTGGDGGMRLSHARGGCGPMASTMGS